MSDRALLVHHAIGETRAVVLAADGTATALFHERWVDEGKRLRWGQTAEGRIAKLSPENGGIFLELQCGEQGFLAARDMTGRVEGAVGLYQVTTEARAGKLTKLVEATEAATQSAFELWLESLPGDGVLTPETGPDAYQTIAHVFEDALNPIAPLAAGGRLQITPTPALIAVDVDTIGRTDKGRASARAKAVNLDAASALGRALCLRGLGGAIVLDCIAPLARRDGPDVKAEFLKVFRAGSTRRAECLNPSPFGLMEAVVERRVQPLHEAYYDEQGQDLPVATMLEGLRQAEREATANRAGQLRLSLPAPAFAAFNTHKALYMEALTARFGARITVLESTTDKIEVTA